MGIIKDDFLKEEKAKAEAKQKSKYEEALSKYNTDIDDKAVQEAVRKIITEKVHQNDTMEVKKFLMGSIELTTLAGAFNNTRNIGHHKTLPVINPHNAQIRT